MVDPIFQINMHLHQSSEQVHLEDSAPPSSRVNVSMIKFLNITTSRSESLTQQVYPLLLELTGGSDHDGSAPEESEDAVQNRLQDEKKRKRQERIRKRKAVLAHRRSRTVPELIFHIEQWESALLKLTGLKNKNTKRPWVNLGSAANFKSLSRARDFKVELKGLLQQSSRKSSGEVSEVHQMSNDDVRAFTVEIPTVMVVAAMMLMRQMKMMQMKKRK